MIYTSMHQIDITKTKISKILESGSISVTLYDKQTPQNEIVLFFDSISHLSGWLEIVKKEIGEDNNVKPDPNIQPPEYDIVFEGYE